MVLTLNHFEFPFKFPLDFLAFVANLTLDFFWHSVPEQSYGNITILPLDSQEKVVFHLRSKYIVSHPWVIQVKSVRFTFLRSKI